MPAQCLVHTGSELPSVSGSKIAPLVGGADVSSCAAARRPRGRLPKISSETPAVVRSGHATPSWLHERRSAPGCTRGLQARPSCMESESACASRSRRPLPVERGVSGRPRKAHRCRAARTDRRRLRDASFAPWNSQWRGPVVAGVWRPAPERVGPPRLFQIGQELFRDEGEGRDCSDLDDLDDDWGHFILLSPGLMEPPQRPPEDQTSDNSLIAWTARSWRIANLDALRNWTCHCAGNNKLD